MITSRRRLILSIVQSVVIIGMVGGLVVLATKATQIPKWQTDGIPICTAVHIQEHPHLISDGSGGAIIIWEDQRDPHHDHDIYAQRVLGDGTATWEVDGVPVSTASDFQQNPRLIPDEAGGAIIVWQDRRPTSSGSYDIYAQRILSDGAVAWPADGVPVTEAAAEQINPKIISDGGGGAIIAWLDGRDNPNVYYPPSGGIYAQRILSDGTIAWADDGVPVSVIGGSQDLHLVSDGRGGAFIAWVGSRGFVGVYVQRILGDGTVAWETDGVPVSQGSVNTHGGLKNPQLVPDETGGATIVWQNKDRAIYAQRVLDDGTFAWANDGVTVSATNGERGERRDARIVSDGAGGAIIVWQDTRNLAAGYDIYAQRVLSDGALAWSDGDVPVSQAIGTQWRLQAVSDGVGGAFVVWEDLRTSSEEDIYAQHIFNDGSVAWGSGGIPVSTASGRQRNPQLSTNGIDTTIIAWEDARETYDIYAQQILDDGTLVWRFVPHRVYLPIIKKITSN